MLKKTDFPYNLYVGQISTAEDTSPILPLDRSFIEAFAGQYVIVYGISGRRRTDELTAYKAMVLYHSDGRPACQKLKHLHSPSLAQLLPEQHTSMNISARAMHSFVNLRFPKCRTRRYVCVAMTATAVKAQD